MNLTTDSLQKMKYIETKVPGRKSIKLIDYYESFVSYYPECELETKSWFVNNVQRDWVVFDCGANIGYYSILFSQLADKGKVFSFEPSKQTIEKLQRNLKYNKISDVTVISKALSDRSGVFVDNIYHLWGSPPLKQHFDFITIDDFIKTKKIKRLDCIKIDVDSYDFSVLRGAKDTIKRFDPYIMVELNHALNLRQENVIQALQWMQEQGYEHVEVYDEENFLFKKSVVSNQKKNINIIFPEKDYKCD